MTVQVDTAAGALRRLLVTELLDAPDPAQLLAMRAEATYHRRRNIAWFEASEGHVEHVDDLTSHGPWPHVCDARSAQVQDVRHVATSHAYVCTRRAGHTGRHAAGTGRRIVAVWSR